MNSQGFTLLEMLLSVGIIAALAGISLPLYLSFQHRNDLAITAESTANALRRAQLYARSAKDDNQWGVKVQATTVTLFRGSSFASRNTSYDEVINVPGSMSVNSTPEVVFAKMTGAPSPTSFSVQFTSGSNETKTVSMNAKGAVSY